MRRHLLQVDYLTIMILDFFFGVSASGIQYSANYLEIYGRKVRGLA